ncbi:hypothetical protein RMONA_00635 [Rickettsia monacensis]|uniref:Uncharacterized protein n=1 Tax=Rickettsia monacensis TaxID=109232 RepID=A0A0B7J2P8_9RICK|nr:hypothetical protein RMONA_00635 [Rickettsia monacensis]
MHKYLEDDMSIIGKNKHTIMELVYKICKLLDKHLPCKFNIEY